ncbi:MAG TPA: S41 family peptidase, partial [Acidobacteriota bacterium]|nr:S41 family peptidase [Acidobacteriota bacterium]
RFRDPEEAAATAIAAMNFLGHCDALIIDLIDNGGGEPKMVTLIASYLFDRETLFNTMYTPRDDSTVQLWTETYVPGPRLSQCDVYVLISFDTFSAGEDLAYNLKHSGRATLVGTQTPGGAHDEEFHNCRNLGIRIKVPYRRAISPFTGTNWEGVGVAPDIEAPAYKAFDVAYLEAVKGIRARTTDEELLAQLDWILPALESDVNPVVVNEDVLKGYTGIYGPVTVTYDHGTLLAQQTNRRPMELVAMSQTMFNCQWMNEFRLEFHPGAEGTPDSVTAYLDDGGVFQLPRTE